LLFRHTFVPNSQKKIRSDAVNFNPPLL